MKKLILTLLNFFIVLTFGLSPVYANHQAVIGGTCPDTITHVMTSLGCVPTSTDYLAGAIVDLAIKIGGGVAFVFLLMGSFEMVTSGGNPDSIQHAKHRITSAITGLLLIVFSVVILRIAGIDVLGIPGFQRGTNSIILP